MSIACILEVTKKKLFGTAMTIRTAFTEEDICKLTYQFNTIAPKKDLYYYLKRYMPEIFLFFNTIGLFSSTYLTIKLL